MEMERVKFYSLNGFMYPLDRFLPSNVENVWRWNWTQKKAIEFAKSITEPCTLIGFSDGATAALEVAQNSIYVQKVYCHSCMNRSHEKKRKFEVSFFRTIGDKTPTYNQTYEVYMSYLMSYYPCSLCSFAPVELKGKKIRDLLIGPLNHQFHNCLPYISFRGTSG
jgi:hypothetical protein